MYWNKHIDDSKFTESQELFADMYAVPCYEVPPGHKATLFLNKYYQSRYGMFTCHGSKQKYGFVPFHLGLIEQWEKPKDAKRQWDISIMSCLVNGAITWDDLKKYKKTYRDGRAFKKYLNKN
jgi:hypothetical protein